jgi:hypothetical protein
MNADCPGNRYQDQRNNEPGIGLSAVIELHENINRHDNIEEKITVEYQHIPGKERLWEGEPADHRDQVPESIGPAQIDENEEKGHYDGRSGPQFADYDDLLYRFEVVNVCGYHKEDGCRCYPYQVGKIGYIKAPGDFIAHMSGDKTFVELLNVIFEPEYNEEEE